MASTALRVLMTRCQPFRISKTASVAQCNAFATTSFSSKNNFLEKVDERNKKRTELESWEYFEKVQDKNKENFKAAIDLFNKSDPRRRGAVEFVNAALKNLKKFGVHRDLETYKALLQVFPKGKFVPKNFWQVHFQFYPKQHDCGRLVLQYMIRYKVMPDEELLDIVKNAFGRDSPPFAELGRMFYWMPKLKNLSPWPLPFHLPNDPLELAKLAIKRITSVDALTEVKVFHSSDLPESTDKTWIVSGMSPAQQDMISEHPKSEALFVEGAFRLWLHDKQVNYYVLRGGAIPRPPPPQGDDDDVTKLKNWALGEVDPNWCVKIPNVHQQEDASIFGCCATGTSSKDSLLSWIRFLQLENMDLENVPILFNLTSPLGEVIPILEEMNVDFRKK